MINSRRDVAIVGIGLTNFRALYQERGILHDKYGLAAQALRDALADAGLTTSDLDAMLCSRVDYARMADVVGARSLRFAHDLEGSGRMSGVALQEACALIGSGLADVVACVYGNDGRSVNARYAEDVAGPTAAFDAIYGMTSPGAYVAMMYQRYRHLYGAPEDALAPLAINNRRNAARNPVAVFDEEIGLDEYLASRYIAEPLRLFDYCMINDGGVAFIVTTAERAASLRQLPARVVATAGRTELTNYYTSTDFFHSACADVACRLYREAGMGPGDMQCLQVYDNFLPTILFALEGFGYAERGTAWEWVRDGRIALEGSIPLNTSGGHTSESYMQGWALHVEAVRQVRGQCDERQVPGCEVVHYMCASPIVTSHVLAR